MRQLDELVLRNVENLRWAVLRGIDETFRLATARLEDRLGDATAATEGVIQAAHSRRRDRSSRIEPELDSLRRDAVALAAAREALNLLQREMTAETK
jgi:hypothetical protein